MALTNVYLFAFRVNSFFQFFAASRRFSWQVKLS